MKNAWLIINLHKILVMGFRQFKNEGYLLINRYSIMSLQIPFSIKVSYFQYLLYITYLIVLIKADLTFK